MKETIFKDFKTAVQKQFNEMKNDNLFTVTLDKDLLWETYLASFPEGTNPIFRERTSHDCQCCKQFIRAVGSVVALIDGDVVSIWDCGIDGHYGVVAKAMAELVKSSPIENIFLHIESTAGTDKNFQNLESGTVLTWEHFFVKIPNKFIVSGDEKGSRLGEAKSTRDVFYRSLSELTIDAIDTVLELIAQNSLYRGEENKFAVEAFRKYKNDFDKLSNEERYFFCWNEFGSLPKSVTNFRNTAIGTLVMDLSEGRDLESTVKSFESKVAPTNYKRPTALITKSMIKKAQDKVEELGFTSALSRRYAVAEDITINNVLFADRAAKKAVTGNVFDELAETVPEKIQKLDKVEEVPIKTFLENVLPNVESIELMLENRHAGNFVSLVAPVNIDSKNMFKWHNNFSWAYAGDLTDSIKERVKAAGGKVDGDLRCSLSWFNYDDLDLHMREPGNGHVGYMQKISRKTGGNLDVDMNVTPTTTTPVENICYPDRNRMLEGVYELYVNNFNKRDSVNTGFEVEIEFNGVVHSFSYNKPVKDRENVTVARIKYSKEDGFEIIKSMPSSVTSKEIWNLSTQHFHRVSMIMNSPNFWDGRVNGNQHVFFMIDGCKNDKPARGFFNEFLTDDLREHRKVFEVLGAKMKTSESDRQLSGLGFSTTQRSNVLARVKGTFTRTIKIVF